MTWRAMSVDFPNCLVSDSTGCDRKWETDDGKFRPTGRPVNGTHRFGGSDDDDDDDPTGCCRRLDVDDFSDDSCLPVRKSFDVASRDRTGAAAADSKSSPQRKLVTSLAKSGSLDWTSTLESNRIQVKTRPGGRRCSVDDLTRLLERVKATFGPGPGVVSVRLSPPESNPGDEASSSSSSSNGEPRRSDTLFSTGRRQHKPLFHRKSLPDRLTDYHVTTARQGMRKRSGGRRGGVKFADDFGLNLNTFVMIPSRYSAHAQPEVSLVGRRLSLGGDAGKGSGGMLDRKSMLLLRELGLDYENDRIVFRSDTDSTDHARKIRGTGPDPQTVRAHNPEFSTKKTLQKKRGPDPAMTSQPEADFRLCFDQPFADLENFRRRLGTDFLCLENVRVDDGASRSPTEDPVPPGTGLRSSPVPGAVTILCSIKVRRCVHRKSVFARCTDNDWSTYADLPGEYLPGVTNLGLEYDTFCFAVRRPVHRRRNGDPPTRSWKGTDGRPPTSAVEFAVCAVVSSRRGNVVHWDNNNGSNYRIEWFD